MNHRIRPATADDLAFLEEIFVVTADWNPATAHGDAFWRADPSFEQYVGGFPRETDRGFVAEIDGAPVGAVWSRFHPDDARGYGYVDASIPELGIGIIEGHRGQGIGRALLEAMIAATPGDLSLSVEDGNPAIELYRSAGFEAVGRFGEATTMLHRAS